MPVRKVQVAFGFTDGTWREVEIEVPEEEERVLDEDEVREEALLLARQMEFDGKMISFRSVLHISSPEGGYCEESWPY
ncbi:MAG: hypothetical protein GF334_03295 [Candidatus Altiarchaeales archaeon]|nr:hypothetical protein [Candidatus Altiarchaeales archaeon]